MKININEYPVPDLASGPYGITTCTDVTYLVYGAKGKSDRQDNGFWRHHRI
ncbi:hypothetical protein [Bacillus paralicheniformis]|uniref:hypothetical protein n=1 Tax=Bacillus paralicheniformis TaxID=1648923 RepID=UPI00186BA8FE|nr:hypothetical protein [Bacillus paralicheniformis]